MAGKTGQQYTQGTVAIVWNNESPVKQYFPQAPELCGEGLWRPWQLKALPKQSGEYLLEVIMRRYENRSTIMTSNRPLEEWGKLLNDVPTAGAILDRFLHHAQVIAITGRSYRVKNSVGKAVEGPEQQERTSNEPLAAGAAS